VTALPFVKWVGSKRSIVDVVLSRMPDSVEEYYEPFVGGGAVFFALVSEGRVRHAHLSDTNQRLITTYTAVRDDPQGVIKLLRQHSRKSEEAYFYKLRDAFNGGGLDGTSTAAAFIYLNKTCYNGLWRVNKDGDFNVPWGHHKSRYIPDEDGIMAASRALAGAEISCRPFDATPIEPDGFYYLDPPYDETYADYHHEGFGHLKQELLADFTAKLDVAEAGWLLSNSDTPFIRSLYAGCNISVVESKRTVGCTPASRGRVNELLISP